MRAWEVSPGRIRSLKPRRRRRQFVDGFMRSFMLASWYCTEDSESEACVSRLAFASLKFASVCEHSAGEILDLPEAAWARADTMDQTSRGEMQLCYVRNLLKDCRVRSGVACDCVRALAVVLHMETRLQNAPRSGRSIWREQRE